MKPEISPVFQVSMSKIQAQQNPSARKASACKADKPRVLSAPFFSRLRRGQRGVGGIFSARRESFRHLPFSKLTGALSALGIFFFVLCSQANASWLIDARKFHASVHGQNSCQDCHEDVQDRDLHPNPQDINKGVSAFFHVDDCLACHDDVLDALEEGSHGTEAVEDPEIYEACLECHDPHYEEPVREEPGRFDPSVPRYEQCGACHEPQSELPPFLPEDETCMTCHRAMDPDDAEAAETVAMTCFHCHGNNETAAQIWTGKKGPLMDPDDYASSTHAGLTCTICHPSATGSRHGLQIPGVCEQCHRRHDEKVAHDLHALVSCEACHLREVQPVRDSQSKRILWESEARAGQISEIHDMSGAYDEAACRRCHKAGNEIGAAAMVLPAKSILCMPCHGATFSIGDTTTLIALGVLIVGMAMILSYVFSGSLGGEATGGFWIKAGKILARALRTIFSSKAFLMIKALFLDVLLQRRLYRQSAKRWFIHSLIFYPFVFRFVWGLIGLLGSLWKPHWSWIWPMLNKNHPLTAFLFDLTGIMVIVGVGLAFIRGYASRAGQAPGQPKQDRIALALLAGIVVLGFVLEGMRMAMTGYPEGSAYAFLGHAISQFFKNAPGVTGAYGYFWYVHAVLTGAFVAYLPFSRLAHIITAPLVLAMNAAMDRDHGKRS
jgi:nitrate reductase gamma subunit